MQLNVLNHNSYFFHSSAVLNYLENCLPILITSGVTNPWCNHWNKVTKLFNKYETENVLMFNVDDAGLEPKTVNKRTEMK